MRKYQFAAVSSAATTTTAPIFCGSGSLLMPLRTSVPVRAICPPFLSGVIRAAVDFPLHDAVVLLLRPLDDDVLEVGRGLQLLGEGAQVFVGGGFALHAHPAALLAVGEDPHLLRDERGQLVHHLDRAGAALLQGV